MDQTLHETASSSHPRPVNTWRHWIPIGFSLAMQWGWAIWWGGLTFYAAIVVPVGTEQFGSFGQGLVTLQVTRYLNALAMFVAILAIVEGIINERPKQWAGGILLGGVTAALMYQHTLLIPRIDTVAESVADDFYDAHATYLWLTTLQWCIGLFLGIRRGFGRHYHPQSR